MAAGDDALDDGDNDENETGVRVTSSSPSDSSLSLMCVRCMRFTSGAMSGSHSAESVISVRLLPTWRFRLLLSAPAPAASPAKTPLLRVSAQDR